MSYRYNVAYILHKVTHWGNVFMSVRGNTFKDSSQKTRLITNIFF